MATGIPGYGRIADELRQVTVQVLDDRDGSTGSGVITGPSTVVTNAHVVRTKRLYIRTAAGAVVRATLVKHDRARDLAVLNVAGVPLSQSAGGLVETSSLRPGETAIAVGHPLGFIGAVSVGSIRSVGPVPGLGDRTWVQAAIRLAPGNSGGPLADIHGRIIGINAMVVNGVGLAVPSEAVQRVLSATPPFHLGVTVRPAQLLDGTRGMLILDIEPESPASRASLLPGDLISGIDTARTPGVEALETALGRAGAENRNSVVVHFRRGGNVRERQATAARSFYAEPAA
jgi:serine protease Do